jgi:hypothetical protein
VNSRLRALLEVPDDALTSLRRLRASALELAAPSPLEMLDGLPLQPRTVNCLRRYAAAGPNDGDWTIGRLLAIPGFGVAALTDAVHAARVTASGPAPKAPVVRLEDEIAPLLTARPKLVPDVSRALLERAMKLLAAIVPVTADEALRRLREAEITRGTLTVAELERAARFSPSGASFAIVRRDRYVLLVAADQRALAERIHRVATRLVSRWGASSLELVAHQLQTNELDLVRSVVTAREDFSWLDRRRGWFSFEPRKSQLARTIERLVASTSPWTLELLRVAVARSRAAELVPPITAIAALCAQLPLLRVEGDRVWPVHSGPGALGFAGA